MTAYKGFTIETHRDTLGKWRVTVHDRDTTLFSLPADDLRGMEREQQAVYAARGKINEILSKGY